MSDQLRPDDFDDERTSEVEDLTDRIPRTEKSAPAEPTGPQPTGFGAGDVVDVDDLDANGDSAASTPDAADVDLDAVIAERDQFRDMAQRLQADFENFRKRAATQSAAEVDRATGKLAEALIPVLDAADEAAAQHPDEVGPLRSAILTELGKHGLEAVELEGQPFDPEVAEAVAHTPGEGGDLVVAEVFRPGYRWREKTLRAGMVRTTD